MVSIQVTDHSVNRQVIEILPDHCWGALARRRRLYVRARRGVVTPDFRIGIWRAHAQVARIDIIDDRI